MMVREGGAHCRAGAHARTPFGIVDVVRGNLWVLLRDNGPQLLIRHAWPLETSMNKEALNPTSPLDPAMRGKTRPHRLFALDAWY